VFDPKEIEPKWQMRWREAGAFNADPDPQRPKYYMTVPYPYANAPYHVGHGRTYTIGDIVARYKRMQGFNVLWPMAAHVTGTPVFGIARRIQEKDSEILKEYSDHINLYRSKKEIEPVLATFTDPTAIAQFFSSAIEGDFRKLGYSIDWRRKFTTNDPEYNAFITWQFQKLKSLGYITKGSYPILYCVDCQNAVGEHDLLKGEDAKVAEFVAIKFPFEDGFLVAATLRPETVFGVTNVWINPEKTYIKVQVQEEFWYVAKQAARKLVNQGHHAKRLEEIPGREFIGKVCRSPIDDRELLILPASFVDSENATGVVYSVPSHAPFDWIALRDLQQESFILKGIKLDKKAVKQIQPISIISIEGYGEHPAIEIVEKMKIKNQEETQKLEEATETLYRAEFYNGVMKPDCEPFANRKVSEVKEDVISYLMEKNRAFRFYQPDQKPVVCRCGNDVVVAVLPDQWFINYGHPEWKAEATKALAQMSIYPEIYRRLFEATFNWLKERPAARRRGLGTPLPFDKRWIVEALSDSTIYMSYYLLIPHIRANKIESKQLNQTFFDYVLLGKGDPEEVSEKTQIPQSTLETIRQEVDYWYPNDHRHSGIDLVTNHLSFFIFHHVALFPKKYWPKTITVNEFVNMEGSKMSKSLGNVIPLALVPQRYGADLFRLYVTQVADLPTVVDWREKDVMTVRRRFNRLHWIFQEACKTADEPLQPETLSMSSRWVLSKTNSTIRAATEALDNLRFRTYILFSFFQLIGHVDFYLRRIPKKSPERGPILRYIVKRWVKLLAPLMPHLCEEAWEKLGNISFVSLENWPEPEEQLLDQNIEDAMDVITQTIADIKEIKGLIRKQDPKTVHIFVSPTWKYDALHRLRSSEAALIVKDLMPILMKEPHLKKRGKEVTELVQSVIKAGGFWTFVNKESEFKAFKDNIEFIQAETGLTVKIQDADKPTEDPENRASKALPGRPALYLA
jgi:leucyl-tRNA synthetase